MKIYPSPESIENTPFGYFLKQITPGSKVLEFGPSVGYMTRYMKEQLGCSVTCVEINPESARIAGLYADKMIVADVDSGIWAEELSGPYDYILFADVLEHLRDPEKAVKTALGFLAENGYIITSIPNIAHNAIILSLASGKFGYTQFGLLDDSHIHFFTWESMQEMFGRLGLNCVEERDACRIPSSTELPVFYCCHPILSLSLFSKKDGHTYQFICKWGKTQTPSDMLPIKRKGCSVFYLPRLFYLDFGAFLKHKNHQRRMKRKSRG